MMASGSCDDGTVFPHFAQDISNLVIDDDYVKEEEGYKKVEHDSNFKTC